MAQTGQRLLCIRNLHLREDACSRVFTDGHYYRVVCATGAVIRIEDDDGTEQWLSVSEVRQHFTQP